jgi:hypothetical protein
MATNRMWKDQHYYDQRPGAPQMTTTRHGGKGPSCRTSSCSCHGVLAAQR